MPTYTDRATRTLKLQKAERPKIGHGLPPVMDGFEGENRIQIVNGNPRLYYRTQQGWYYTGLAKDGDDPDLPIATSTTLGLIKIGTGGSISSDGTYDATAATPDANDIATGDEAVDIATSSGAVTIGPAGNNADVHIKGTDDGSTITALTFDMSAAGAATFNNNVTIGALFIMPDVTNHKILVSDGTSYQEVALSGDATIANTGAITLAAAQTNITSIYATDLIMGEDSQTAIDFGTANEIDFKADNAARLTLTASALYPVTNNQIDLGTSSLEFKDAFFDGTVTSDAFAGPLTGDVTGNVSGNAGTVTVATRSTDAWHYLLFSSSTSGSLSVYDNGSIKVNPNSGTLSVPLLTISTSLTVQELLAADNIDIGSHGFRAQELYADARTSGRVAIYAANGQLQDDSDLTFSGSTLTATAISGNLTGNVSGNLTGTVLTATQGTINHDSLSGFVANEHIDWTSDQGSTNIDGGNYTDTTYSAGTLLDLSSTTFNVDLTEAPEDTIANGDYILFLDGGATGSHKKEALADLVGIMAGDNLTASGITLNFAATDFKEHDDVEPVTLGGTGATSLTSNAVLTGNGTSAITAEGNLTFDGTHLTIATGSIQVRTIDYSDGDNAITIADGGGITVAQASTFSGNIKLSSSASVICTDTSDGSDNKMLTIGGGGAVANTGRGAFIDLYGEDYTSNTGNLDIVAGNSGVTRILCGTNAATTALSIAVNGNATFSGTIYGEADVYAYYSSDPVLKENKELIDNPLEKICKLGGYSFDWKESAKEYGNHLEGHDYGVMADEIQELFPELVQTRDNGIRAVKYDKLVPLLIEGIKELKQELNVIRGES